MTLMYNWSEFSFTDFAVKNNFSRGLYQEWESVFLEGGSEFRMRNEKNRKGKETGDT